jgi:hypothetical protein
MLRSFSDNFRKISLSVIYYKIPVRRSRGNDMENLEKYAIFLEECMTRPGEAVSQRSLVLFLPLLRHAAD